MAFINKHDTNGTKGLLAKGELGYDDYAAGGDTGRVYVGTGVENIALAERLESNMMTKAQFNALAEERKANRAGSGFENFGKGSSTSTANVNEGIWTDPEQSNRFYLGKTTANSGASKTNHAEIITNGVLQELKNVNSASALAEILLPTAPNIYPHDTVLTPEQIASGVIKHADASNSGLIVNGKFDTDTSGWNNSNNTVSLSSVDGKLQVRYVADRWSYQSILTVVGKKYKVSFSYRASGGGIYAYFRIGTYVPDQSLYTINTQSTISTTYEIEFTATTTTTFIHCGASNSAGQYAEFDNIAVYPADAISRSDLVFPESYHEDIAEKGVGYPFGNVQYLGGNTDGLTGITNGAFTGFEQYSLFGNWQTPSSLIGKGYVWSSLTEAQKKAFVANPKNNCYLDGDKIIQVRYRVRVVQGLGDSWTKVSPESVNSTDARYSTLNYTDGITKYVQLKGKTVSLTSDIENTIQKGFFVTKDKASFYDGVDSGLWIGVKATNTILDNTSSYEGKCFALPIALASRRNQGMYHNVYNPNGTKLASDGLDCFTTTISFNSISDCFDPTKLLTASGYIGTVSGRPDGLFYDQVHEGDVQDLRNNSKKSGYKNRLISIEFNKLVAGTYRGKEGEIELRSYLNSTINSRSQYTYVFGSCTYVKLNSVPPSGYLQEGYIDDSFSIFIKGNTQWYKAISASTVNNNIILHPMYGNVTADFTVSSSVEVIFIKKSTRTKSNTLLYCDIIGNPTNYPTAWKESGVFGTPLIVAEDGTSLLPDGIKDSFKLSRKANATPLLCLRSTDKGISWTSFTPTFNTTTNAITLTDEPAGNLVLVYYQTHTSMAVPVINSEVVEIGDVYSSNSQYTTLGNTLVNNLIGKIPVGSLAPVSSFNGKSVGYKFFNQPIEKLDTAIEYKPTHTTLPSLGTTASPAVKVLPYLTRLNGKAYLNLVFKEMKHNGTSWGDDAKFNIVDNVSTTTDNNAQTVLIGQKTVELPYFIGADE